MRNLLACASLALLVACGSNSGSGDGGGGSGDDDGFAPGTDGSIGPANCVAGSTECTDCIDNDTDGRIDGFDPECSGPLDNDEGSFATGIPGDNIDEVFQDCFFDGNSGHEDDGCQIPTCCMLDPNAAGCPPPAPPNLTCAPTQMCIDACKPLTPPGCDCFGCCTVCDPDTNECRDIVTNPAVAPDCDDTSILDPQKCPSCTKVTSCSTDCGGQTCILCPGQDTSDLPSSCGGTNSCPDGALSCTSTACPEGSYCASGCCQSIIL
jgi:hypothetical protein